MYRFGAFFISLVALVVAAGPVMGAISYTTSGGTIIESFDSLANAGTNVAWANDSTLPGWSLFRQDAALGSAAITAYNTGTGSSNTGSFYSFGASASAERALGGVASGGAYFGSPASGNVAGWVAVAIVNDTGGLLDEFDVEFDGEQWRNGGNTSTQTMVLEYGFGASFSAVASWTAPGGAFDFTSPIASATAGALDGNAPANRTADLGGAIGSLSWADGDTLWIRWIENNDTGNDHGLAIDNFSFSATPEPATMSLLVIGGLAALRRRRA